MAFDLFNQTYLDREFMRRNIEELIQIAGAEIKYMPGYPTQKILDDGMVFRGEDPSLQFSDTYIVKGVMTKTPEAAKIWEAMGFYSTDAAAIIFSKSQIIGIIGRPPWPRDRMYLTYNDAKFEVTDVVEVPPDTLFEIFTYEVKVKKLVESFEDPELFEETFTGSRDYWPGNPSATSGNIDTISRGSHVSGGIENAASGISIRFRRWIWWIR